VAAIATQSEAKAPLYNKSTISIAKTLNHAKPFPGLQYGLRYPESDLKK
jgi:hypothetical protein